MKQILLMRHAKSSWGNPDLKDFDRPLEKRGKNDAPMIGKFIHQSGYMPGLIISSTAQRAKETTQHCAEAAQIKDECILWNEDLYFGSVRDYAAAIKSAPDEIERLMLVGHNPLMENIAGILAGAEYAVAIRMPTAAVVCLESFSSTWAAISPDTCQLKWMIIPKLLKKI
ncbi:MAG: histidine phosphatase family protein, partial [Balneolaceae bacterium]